MNLYRLAGAEHATLLNGMGAASKRDGARWNPAGVPMIYASEHRSLAFSEVAAHFQEMTVFPRNHVLVTYAVTGTKGIRRPPLTTLPADWNAAGPPYPRSTQAMGAAFIASSDLLMRVPSVIIPHEWNYLINPNAVKGRLTIAHIEPFRWDERFDLFRRK